MSTQPLPALPDDLDELRQRLEAGHIAEVEAQCRAWIPQVKGVRRIRLQLQEAGCLQARGRYLEALKDARAALDAAQDEPEADDRLRAEGLLVLGMALQGLEAQADALEVLHEADLLAPEGSVLKSRILRRLGVGCSVIGRHDQARELLRLALERLPDNAPAADRWHLSFSLLNAEGRAVDEVAQRDGPDASATLTAYARLRDEWIGFTTRIASTRLRRLEQMGMGNAGIASLRARDLDAALHWLTLAGERHREAGMLAHLATTQMYLGDCLHRLGRPIEALAELEESQRILQGGSPRDLLECWELLAPLYELQGRTADALHAHKAMRAIEKQLADDQARQRADRLRQEAEVAALIADWSRKADQDPLTGLANRRAFDRTLANWVAQPDAVSGGALLLADLDHFKRINDRFGHQVGDAVLQKVAALLQQLVRREDLAVRLGGEELGLLVRTPGEYSLAEIGERLRAEVEGAAWESLAPGLGVTLSIGAATLAEVAHTQDAAAAIYRLADRRLYAAKHAGRNCVVTHDP